MGFPIDNVVTGLISSKSYFVVIDYKEKYIFLTQYLLFRRCGDFIHLLFIWIVNVNSSFAPASNEVQGSPPTVPLRSAAIKSPLTT